MDSSFQAAANPTLTLTRNVVPFTFVCDWSGTILLDRGATNWKLLHLLSDAQKAGHQVIFTSSTLKYMSDSLEIMAELTPEYGFEFKAGDFQVVGKDTLRLMSDAYADFVFDGDPVSYIKHTHHITVYGSGNTSPFSLDDIRGLVGLPDVSADRHPAPRP